MSGFAVSIRSNLTVQAQTDVFRNFSRLVAEYKNLALSAEYAIGKHCIATKLDSPSSLHRGITRDERTGSWLLATGTVVDVTGDGNSDPSLDALLRDYLENEAGALQRYDGHFALVIYDGREESLAVISDPIGLFSIFYGSQGDRTYISTSALAVARQIQAKPDTLTVDCFLRTGRVYGDKTLWQDVRRLPPATILKITHNKVQESEYWAPTIDGTIAHLSFNEALAQAVDMLSRTFKRSLQREGKVWADLTGGFDTRLTTMLMAAAGIPFISYCAGPADHLDVKLSRAISQEMGWEYRHMSLPDDWEHKQCAWSEIAVGKGDAHLNAVQLAGVLSGHQERAMTSKIHVLGLGGENWRGYYWSGELLNIARTPTINLDHILDSKILYPVPVSVLRSDRTQVRQALREYFEKLTSRYAELPNTVKLDSLYLFHRHPTHSGAYLSAAAGIMRSLIPLCFKEPTTFAFSLNYGWKLPRHHRFIRAMLERENPRLANMMTTSGGPAVPLRVTNIHRFGPLWKELINGATRKASRKIFGKSITIWSQKSNPAKYPLPALRRAWLDFTAAKGLLRPSEMHSGALYNADALQTLVSQAGTEDFQHGEFLDRVITVEMAMRQVGASVE